MSKPVRKRTRPQGPAASEASAADPRPAPNNDNGCENTISGSAPEMPEHPETPETPPIDDPVLSARIKIAVMMYIAGARQAAIAARLQCSERTVRTYLAQGRSMCLGIAESLRPEREIARLYLRIEAERSTLVRLQARAEADGDYGAAIRCTLAITALDHRWLTTLTKLGLFKGFAFEDGEQPPGVDPLAFLQDLIEEFGADELDADDTWTLAPGAAAADRAGPSAPCAGDRS